MPSWQHDTIDWERGILDQLNDWEREIPASPTGPSPQPRPQSPPTQTTQARTPPEITTPHAPSSTAQRQPPEHADTGTKEDPACKRHLSIPGQPSPKRP
jgi:hypothetical protein